MNKFIIPPGAINKKETINCLLADGGIGDLLCYLVAVDYIIKNCSWINLLVFCPDYMVDFAKNVLPPKTSVRGFSKQKKYIDGRVAITTKWDERHSPMKRNPIDYGFHSLVDTHIYDDKVKSYLKLDVSKINIEKFKLPANYVVIQAYATETVKRLPGAVINQIAEYIIARGFTPIFVGSKEAKTGVSNKFGEIKMTAKESENIDFSRGIDLTNKTSLLELGAIIDGAKSFIGMDGGIFHVASFTATPIIAGFTLASPLVLSPIRDGVKGLNFYPVTPNISCQGCQHNSILVYDKDYRDCLIPKVEDKYTCVKELTFEKFKECIDEVL